MACIRYKQGEEGRVGKGKAGSMAGGGAGPRSMFNLEAAQRSGPYASRQRVTIVSASQPNRYQVESGSHLCRSVATSASLIFKIIRKESNYGDV